MATNLKGKGRFVSILLLHGEKIAIGLVAAIALWFIYKAAYLPRLGADCLQVPLRRGVVRILTKRFVEAAHRAGVPVQVWAVNDATTMTDVFDLGVDGS